MSRLARARVRFEGLVDRACCEAAVVLGLAIFALMLGGIAGRHVLSQGLPMVTELPEQLFPWWVMVSVVLAARRGGHVAVEALTSVLGPRARAFCSALVHLATIVMSVSVVWTVVQVAGISGSDRSPILGLPLVHMHAALVLGFGLLGLLSLFRLTAPAVQDA